jgi:antitoxin MazE
MIENQGDAGNLGFYLRVFIVANSQIDILYKCISFGLITRTNKMRVSTWGNSLAVRIPANVAEALALQDGDDIEITILGERNFQISKTTSHAALAAKLRAYPKKLPADFRFNREEANGR